MNAPLSKHPKLVSTSQPYSVNSVGQKQSSPSMNHIEGLLNIESAIRKAEKLAELKYLIANETKKLVSAKQTFIHKVGKGEAPSKIEIVSSLATVDPNAPMLIALNDDIKEQVSNDESENVEKLFKLKTQSQSVSEYPYSYVLHLPLKNRNGKNISAVSYLRATPFEERDIAIAKRLAETSAHAWAALQPNKLSISRFFTKPVSLLLFLLAILVMFIPVPLTVLAPVEIVPHQPKIVAAPMSGVVDEISVTPNTKIEKGQHLFSFNKIELISKFEVASRNAAVAFAKYKNATQGAFASAESKRELAITKAEYEVAIAERDYAKSQLALADVRAGKSGIILFSGVENWLGKPVSTGERIMQIADPTQIRMKIEVEVSDSIILENGAQVNAFLDSNPLDPVQAIVETQSYQAEKSERDLLVFSLTAKQIETNDTALRIGLRGTAQVKGESVSLWFYLFRKPISAIRQMIGV